MAEIFHSNASSYAGTVYSGSVLGEPLSRDRWNSISDWIPEPVIPEEASSASPPTLVGAPDGAFTTMPSNDHDSDSDIDTMMIRKLHELGLSNFNQREFTKAESFLQKVIDESSSELSCRQSLDNQNETGSELVLSRKVGRG